MNIKKIISQHRRDFTAIYQCEHCGHEHDGAGYDDDNFHRNVVPAMKCPECGETASEDYRPMGTKYADGEMV
jgi:DNA-directed RNA polymerase subunit RPC12/RpoP